MASWRVTVAAVALAAVLPGGAAGAELPDGGGDAGRAGSFEQVLVQEMDARGRPLGPPVEVAAQAGGPDATAPAAPSVATRSARSRDLQAASGCRTVYVHRWRSGYLGETLWKYTQEKYFCWSYPRLTNVRTTAYACCVDPFWRFAGTVGSAGWFYTWGGSSQGGHYSFRQGRFDQVVLGKVTSSAYPWTKIWVRGDGSWSWQTDVS